MTPASSSPRVWQVNCRCRCEPVATVPFDTLWRVYGNRASVLHLHFHVHAVRALPLSQLLLITVGLTEKASHVAEAHGKRRSTKGH